MTILYDNSEVFNRFAIYKKGKLINISEDVPKWYQEYVVQFNSGTIIRVWVDTKENI